MPLLEFHEATSPVLPRDLKYPIARRHGTVNLHYIWDKSDLDPNYSGSTTMPYITL